MGRVLLWNFFRLLQNLKDFIIRKVLMRLHWVFWHEAIRLVTPVLHRLRTHITVLPKVCENIVTILSNLLSASVQLFEILLKFFPCHQSHHSLLNSVIIIHIICICSSLSYPHLLLLRRRGLLLLFTWRLSLLVLLYRFREFFHWIRATLS